jgi:hypothetical protein
MNNSFLIGDKVTWVDAQGTISRINPTAIRGISPCGKYALVWWLRNPVLLSSLTPSNQDDSTTYPTQLNHWQENETDYNTEDNLRDWVKDYEQRNNTDN